MSKIRHPNFNVDDIVFGWYFASRSAAGWHFGYSQVLGPYYTADQKIIGLHFYHKLEDLLLIDWNYDGQKHVPESLKKCPQGKKVDIGNGCNWVLKRLSDESIIIILKKYEYRDKMLDIDKKIKELIEPLKKEHTSLAKKYSDIVQQC